MMDACFLSVESELKTGTTISLLEALLHAMWPGNASTSGTMTVSAFFQAVPQTPLPNGILLHASGP